ncbi:MAG: hypothetical protein C5B44_00665 [Acidobacteria bacterium]|nr:MAG: hypothetical protein C5B44_00665 [Acidobacteriota bacterium]
MTATNDSTKQTLEQLCGRLIEAGNFEDARAVAEIWTCSPPMKSKTRLNVGVGLSANVEHRRGLSRSRRAGF